MTEPKQPETIRVIDTETRLLPVDMSMENTLDAARRIADLEGHIRDYERERRESSERITGQIKSARGEILELSAAIRAGVVKREIECQIQHDYARGVVRIVRTDTADTVDERPMTPDEQQMAMQLVDPEPSPAPKSTLPDPVPLTDPEPPQGETQ